MKIEINKKAPNFTLPDQDNKKHKLGDYIGSWLLIYFYPKDNTPGCTKEACMIRDNFPFFEKLDLKVIGISADSVESHKKFIKKHNLPFTLLSDEKKETLEKYGVLKEKSMFGRSFMGIMRTSFLIDDKGRVVKIYENVKPAIHAEEVLEDVKDMRK